MFDRPAIAECIYRYAELVDRGDFAGVGELLSAAVVTFEGDDRVYRGEDRIRRLYERSTQRYPDGTPMTKHVVTNVIVAEAEDRTAESRSYFTVFQAVRGELALQPVIAGRYRHRFEYSNTQWRISSFHVVVDLLGELGSHLLFELP